MKLHTPHTFLDATIQLPASKSISNRLLIIQAISGQGVIENLSDAEDTVVLNRLLLERPAVMDVGHAGTAFRFLTAFLSVTPGIWTLTGSDRMKKRPIAPLVNALRNLGAEIEYLEEEGFPPLRISGKTLKGGKVSISSGVSSQFISALLMIAPTFERGVELELTGDVVSVPYIEMTKTLMRNCGAEVSQNKNVLTVSSAAYRWEKMEVEYDWSAAAFWYEWVAIAKIPHVLLSGVKPESIQGDARVAKLFAPFGVESSFDSDGLHLRYRAPQQLDIPRIMDFSGTPDLVQPYLASIAAYNYPMVLAGTRNLQWKETDRLHAMKTELQKLGAIIDIAEDSVLLLKGINNHFPVPVSISTYDDHRMAMTFAPFVSICHELEILHPEVVQKSYPNYWLEVQKMGVH